MATPRKRSSSFTKPPEEVTEETQLSEFLDEVATEMFETISQKEEEALPEPEPVEKPFVEESIIPTEDPGPRFIPEPTPPPVTKAPEPPKPVAPRRHPRNIPKFSRYKEL
jgi:outer membrane biosynthesis protein TonB